MNNDKFEASNATYGKRRFYQMGTKRKIQENEKL